MQGLLFTVFRLALGIAPWPLLISAHPFVGAAVADSVLHLDTRQSSSSWFLPNLDHTSGPVRGFVPNLFNGGGQPNFTYPVYKAVSSGDAQGFVNALYSDGPGGGQRDNCWLAGQPRVIYLAPGEEQRPCRFMR